MRRKKFPQSTELIEIINAHGWSLYDIIGSRSYVGNSWDIINKRRPVEEIRFDRSYLFIPTPEEGQTPKDAYETTNGLGPSIRLESLDDRMDIRGDGVLMNGKETYLFNEFYFSRDRGDNSRQGVKKEIITDLENTELISRPHFIIIPSENIIGVFEKYFGIMTSKEYQQGLPTMQRLGITGAIR